MKLSRVLLALVLVAPAAHATPRATHTHRPLLAQRANNPARGGGGHGATQAGGASAGASTSAGAQAAPATNAQGAQGAPAAGGSLDANQVVAHLQSFYNGTTDYEADFAQVSHNRLSGGEQRRNGHVRFLRPGRMRWDYQSPAGDVIVSDGTTLWAYEAAAHQAIQTNIQQSQVPSALSFLTGTGQLANDFTFRLLNAQQYPGGYVLEARPVTPNPAFERILLYVEGAHFQVARSVVYDAQGNYNRFDFSNPRVNVHPAQSVFQWSPPSGTQVVRP